MPLRLELDRVTAGYGKVEILHECQIKDQKASHAGARQYQTYQGEVSVRSKARRHRHAHENAADQEGASLCQIHREALTHHFADEQAHENVTA